MQAITITNQKGGVGKTTTAHVLSTGLTHAGYNVLAIDTDPQTNFTYTAGLDGTEPGLDLHGAFLGDISVFQAIHKAKAGFDMIPGSTNFTGADTDFSGADILRRVVEPIKKNYDFIIIDTPPTLGLLTMNALAISDKVIVPMAADIYSLQGLSQLQELIEYVRDSHNAALRLDGLLLTKYNPRAIINRDLKKDLQEIAAQLHTRLYKTTIREAVAVKEMQFLQGDLFADYPKANVTKDYAEFINEYMGRKCL